MIIKMYVGLEIRYWYSNSCSTEHIYEAFKETGWIFQLSLVRREFPKTATQGQIFLNNLLGPQASQVNCYELVLSLQINLTSGFHVFWWQ